MAQARSPSTRPQSPSASSRSLLLRIPNAKASRLRPEGEQWQFMALGELAVYQIGQPGKAPPPIPARLGGAAGTPGSSGPAAALPTPASLPPGLSPNHPSPGPGTGIVLAVRTTEFPLASTSTVTYEQPNTYILDNGEGFIVKIELELPRKGSHEILDVGARSPLPKSMLKIPMPTEHHPPIFRPRHFFPGDASFQRCVHARASSTRLKKPASPVRRDDR